MCNQECFNMCERVPLIAPTRVINTHFMTPVPQVVICPIEQRRIDHYMTYPVFIPHFINSCQNTN